MFAVSDMLFSILSNQFELRRHGLGKPGEYSTEYVPS